MIHIHYQVFWDPVTGCDRESPGCKNCYAHGEAIRLRDFGLIKFRNGFDTTPHMEAIEGIEYFSKRPAWVQVCQNSDLFNPHVPDDFIKKVVHILWKSPHHHFVVCTKFIERVLRLNLEFPSNVLFGVTVEHSDYLWRAEMLKKVKAKQKGLLLAPILSAMPDLCRYLDGLTHVQCYEERSPNPRPVNPEWVGEIGWQCREKGVYFLNLFRQHLETPYNFHISSLVFQLIEHTPGIIALPNQWHPRSTEYMALCAKLRHIPHGELKEMVGQVAPEFFEP